MSMAARFRDLHADGFFVLPNAWDAGSAVRLAALGFQALATTSSGHAATLGRRDQQVSFDELCAHVTALVQVIDVPLSVDSERLFAESVDAVSANVRRLADLGAAGASIEDYDPASRTIDDLGTAAARVEAAADAAHEHGLVLTARAENHLYGVGDLDDTIARLRAYRDAGADVLYAPGLVAREDISSVVESVGGPVNVLLLPGGPAPTELGDLGVRRASTGGRLAKIAYEAACTAAAALLPAGAQSSATT